MDEIIKTSEVCKLDLSGKLDAEQLAVILEEALHGAKYDLAYMVFINHNEQVRSIVPVGNPVEMALLLTSGVIEEALEETKQEFLSEELLSKLPPKLAFIIKTILENSEKIIN